MKLKPGMAVHCNTEEKANIFLKECHKQGWKWSSGYNLVDDSNVDNRYNNSGKGIVYYLNKNGLTYDYRSFLLEDKKILSFDDLFKAKEEKKKCKIYTKPKFMNDDVSKVIVSEPCVIVYLDDGEKGVAKCCPEDEFNEELGYEIAYQRATIERLKNEIVKAEKYLRYLV